MNYVQLNYKVQLNHKAGAKNAVSFSHSIETYFMGCDNLISAI